MVNKPGFAVLEGGLNRTAQRKNKEMGRRRDARRIVSRMTQCLLFIYAQNND